MLRFLTAAHLLAALQLLTPSPDSLGYRRCLCWLGLRKDQLLLWEWLTQVRRCTLPWYRLARDVWVAVALNPGDPAVALELPAVHRIHLAPR